MGHRVHSDELSQGAAVAAPHPTTVPATGSRVPPPPSRAAAPYAAKTRGYYRTLSASSVGLELAIAVLIGIFFGRWLDGQLGTTPYMMIVWLVIGFAAGMKGVYRHVAAADRDVARAEAEAAAQATGEARR